MVSRRPQAQAQKNDDFRSDYRDKGTHNIEYPCKCVPASSDLESFRTALSP